MSPSCCLFVSLEYLLEDVYIIIPHCYSDQSYPVEVLVFLEKLGKRWEEFALFLGFTGEEISILQHASHGNKEQEIRNFSKVWRMPDLTKRVNDEILHRVLEKANIDPGADYSLHNVTYIHLSTKVHV